MIKERYLITPVIEDLSEKMVFIGGPRQVGKTTFARELISQHFGAAAYLNWDNRSHRKSIMEGLWPGNVNLIILDEIHKHKKWKTLVKGYYDVLKNRYRFLITGSAQLDLYLKGGDSMLGRYHYYRMHPFTLAEVSDSKSPIKIFKEIFIPDQKAKDMLISLDRFGGFPEPYTKQNARTLRRWHNEKVDRLFREDIRDTDQIRDIYSAQLLGDMLPDRAGSILSINSLREDLEVSHRAASNWLNVMESFYYCFRIYPFVSQRFRSLKKEPKLYLWDWSEISDKAARFENCIASHLLKLVHYLQDYEGYRADILYLRSIEKKEVDFLVTIDEKPWFAVEAKLNETNISKPLYYFKDKLEIPFCYQVVQQSGVDVFKNGIRVVSADRFLLGLK